MIYPFGLCSRIRFEFEIDGRFVYRFDSWTVLLRLGFGAVVLMCGRDGLSLRELLCREYWLLRLWLGFGKLRIYDDI